MNDAINKLPHSKGDQQEVDSRDSKRDETKDAGRKHRHDDTRRRRQPKARHIIMLPKYCNGVSRDPEEGSMTECQKAGIAHEKIEAHDEQPINEDLGEETYNGQICVKR